MYLILNKNCHIVLFFKCTKAHQKQFFCGFLIFQGGYVALLPLTMGAHAYVYIYIYILPESNTRVLRILILYTRIIDFGIYCIGSKIDDDSNT